MLLDGLFNSFAAFKESNLCKIMSCHVTNGINFLWFHKSRVDFDVFLRVLARNWKKQMRRRNGVVSDRWLLVFRVTSVTSLYRNIYVHYEKPNSTVYKIKNIFCKTFEFTTLPHTPICDPFKRPNSALTLKSNKSGVSILI